MSVEVIEEERKASKGQSSSLRWIEESKEKKVIVSSSGVHAYMSKIDQTQGRASRAIDRAPTPRDRACEMTFETEARDRRVRRKRRSRRGCSSHRCLGKTHSDERQREGEMEWRRSSTGNGGLGAIATLLPGKILRWKKPLTRTLTITLTLAPNPNPNPNGFDTMQYLG